MGCVVPGMHGKACVGSRHAGLLAAAGTGRLRVVQRRLWVSIAVMPSTQPSVVDTFTRFFLLGFLAGQRG
jgi:hypothetical protein